MLWCARAVKDHRRFGGLTALDRMRRLAALLALVPILCLPAAADAERRFVERYQFPSSGSFTEPNLCAFPIEVTYDAVETEKWQSIGGTGLDADQTWGQHWLREHDVLLNPANARSVELDFLLRLIRRDIEEDLVFDADGDPSGTITATDYYSGRGIASIPGYGTTLISAGHARVHHTSFIEDGVRIDRLDEEFFNAGPLPEFEPVCTYLSGSP